MKVLVTGSRGFIGKNLCAHLRQQEGIEILEFDCQDSQETLASSTRQADFVVHLAGVNRPHTVEEFDQGNRELTERLLEVLEESDRKPGFLLSSSTQASLDNPYGVSKRKAEQAVFDWASKVGANAFVFRLSNVFGKWCRPNYNSVVATWCNNVAQGLSLRIDDPAKELSLVYIDDVVQEFVKAIQGDLKPSTGAFQSIPMVHQVTLADLARILEGFAESRKDLFLPNFGNPLVKKLYATYLSYLSEDGFGYNLLTRTDNRGWLAEFIKTDTVGQMFVSATKPGITRGNHWHHTKTEKFLVVSGEAVIRFRKIDGNEVLEYPVSGDRPSVVDIPPGYTHNITNVGDSELVTLFWASEPFDPENPDTFYLEV